MIAPADRGLDFKKVFDLEKGEHKGQGQVCVWQSGVPMARSIVCEYERNLSINEENMAKVKYFYKYFTLRKVNLKVNAKFG